MDMQPWRYFLSLERDLIETANFVEPSPANALAFSFVFVKLILLVGSEVDVVAKMLCSDINPTAASKNIVDYRTMLTAEFPGIQKIEITVPRYGMTLRPWATWEPSIAKSPIWWTAYNDVKHERHANLPAANQDNVFHAFSGLLAMLLYLYRRRKDFDPAPELFYFEGLAQNVTYSRPLRLPGWINQIV